jgi:hypothetical protein
MILYTRIHEKTGNILLCARAHIHARMHMHKYMHMFVNIYIYIYSLSGCYTLFAVFVVVVCSDCVCHDCVCCVFAVNQCLWLHVFVDAVCVCFVFCVCNVGG